MQTKKYLLDEKVADAILQYLASRPYREVFMLIQSLQGAAEFVEDPHPNGAPE